MRRARPAMAHAIARRPWHEGAGIKAYADGLAVRVPIRGIVEELKGMVDDVWLVEESRLLSAVKSLIELEQVMVEPSAAITVGGLADHRHAASGKTIVAVLTGSHLDPTLLPQVMASGGLL